MFKDFYKLYVVKYNTSNNLFYMTKSDYLKEVNNTNCKLVKVLYRYGLKTLLTINF